MDQTREDDGNIYFRFIGLVDCTAILTAINENVHHSTCVDPMVI